MSGNRLQMPAPSMPPSLEDVVRFVDWLELKALCSETHRARLDEIFSAIEILHDPELDPAEAESREHPRRMAEIGFDEDSMEEDLRSRLEGEIEFRRQSLNDAYPFELDDYGKELRMTGDCSESHVAFYLCCLLASYMNDDNPLIDLRGIDEIDGLRNRLRNDTFQVLATFALAGLARGPAVRIGWPRRNKESIQEALSRAQEWGIGVAPKREPGPYTPGKVKDGGIDVIAWRKIDRPPTPVVWFGQVATGKNWKDKPASNDIKCFVDDFFDGDIRGHKLSCTLIPRRIPDDKEFHREHFRHGAILDRTRLAREALEGVAMADVGNIEMDHANERDQVTEWVADFAEAICS